MEIRGQSKVQNNAYTMHKFKAETKETSPWLLMGSHGPGFRRTDLQRLAVAGDGAQLSR